MRTAAMMNGGQDRHHDVGPTTSLAPAGPLGEIKLPALLERGAIGARAAGGGEPGTVEIVEVRPAQLPVPVVRPLPEREDGVDDGDKSQGAEQEDLHARIFAQI